MTTKLKITKVRESEFEGSEGKKIKYFWYKGLREGDGVTIEFGSTESYDLDDELELLLEKTETAKGGFRYKEIAQ